MPTVQLVCAASEVPQVFAAMRKSPETLTPCRCETVPPVFAIVILTAALVTPKLVDGKTTAPGVSTIAAGADPFPDSASETCPPGTSP